MYKNLRGKNLPTDHSDGDTHRINLVVSLSKTFGFKHASEPHVNRLTQFFQDSDTEFGVFYPKDHLLAIFQDLPEADNAREALNKAGFTGKGAIAVSGEEVLDFAKNLTVKDGLWGAVMTELSRIFGTEALYAERDLASAKKGEAFLAVHCPTDKGKAEAWKIIQPLHPIVARYYSAGCIEHLVGEV